MQPLQVGAKEVVEAWELSSDSEDEGAKSQEKFDSTISAEELRNHLKIKVERIGILEKTISNLSTRIGTEIVSDDKKTDNRSALALSRYFKNSSDVNTLHYQMDTEFGKNIFFITNVRYKNSFLLL